MLEKKPTMQHTCISSESPNYLLNFNIDYGKDFTFAYKVVNNKVQVAVVVHAKACTNFL